MSSELNAQYYMEGQEPASERWNKIHSEQFQIIYPEGTDSTALYLLNLLEQNSSKVEKDLKHQPRKCKIVLHRNGTVSNGFVSWAPNRSEYFLTPSCTDVPEFSLPLLALHEQRHYVQTSKLSRGVISCIMYPFLGEQFTGGMIGLFLPRWFLEGDAVLTESLLTNSGRGRMPSYSVPLKAQIDYHGRFTYNKAVFGSYKHFIADPYVLGYNMVLYGRHKFGAEIWRNAIKKSADMPFILTPFNAGIKSASSLTKNGIYKKTISGLSINHKNKSLRFKQDDYKNYKYPISYNNGIISARSGYSYYNQVCIDDGSEKVLFSLGRLKQNDRIVYASRKLVWAEQVAHPRWEQKQLSQIHVYDIEQKRKKRIKTKISLYSPALSPDGQLYACLTVSKAGVQSLVLLDSVKNIKYLYKSSSYQDLYQPFWIDNETIGMISADTAGKQMLKVNIVSSEVQEIFNSGFRDISFPSASNEFIFFSGGFEKIRDIYAFSLKSGELYKITDEEYSADFPYFDNKKQLVFYSSYTPLGYRVKSVSFQPDSLPIVDLCSLVEYSRLEEIIKKENIEKTAVDSIDSFPVTKYRKFPHLVNIHSWMPLTNDLKSMSFKTEEIGFQFLSQNTLSSSLINGGYGYSQRDQSDRFFLNWQYMGFYPILDWKNSYSLHNEDDLSYDVYSTFLKAKLKHSLRSGRMRQYFHFVAGIEYQNFHNIKRTNEPSDSLFSKQMLAPSYELYFKNYRTIRYRDLDSRFSQEIWIGYKHFLPGFEFNDGSVFATEAGLTIPSIFKHHLFRFTAGIEIMNDRDYGLLPNLITTARSYIMREEYASKGTETYTASYLLPLVNPDIDLGWLMYMKRVTAEIFYDYTRKDNRLFRSVGVESVFENFMLRIPVPFEMGVRSSYQIDNAMMDYSFLLKLSVDKMP